MTCQGLCKQAQLSSRFLTIAQGAHTLLTDVVDVDAGGYGQDRRKLCSLQ